MGFKKYFIEILSIIALVFIILSRGNIGVLKANVENDARKEHNIPEEWITTKDINKEFVSLLFYSEDLSNFNFSIYQNRPGLSFGYFFSSSGFPGASDRILKVTTNGQGHIFLSMNKIQISKIEIDNGINTKEVLIENTKPFTIIVPENSGEIRFYDIEGNSISDNFIIESKL